MPERAREALAAAGNLDQKLRSDTAVAGGRCKDSEEAALCGRFHGGRLRGGCLVWAFPWWRQAGGTPNFNHYLEPLPVYTFGILANHEKLAVGAHGREDMVKTRCSERLRGCKHKYHFINRLAFVCPDTRILNK